MTARSRGRAAAARAPNGPRRAICSAVGSRRGVKKLEDAHRRIARAEGHALSLVGRGFGERNAVRRDGHELGPALLPEDCGRSAGDGGCEADYLPGLVAVMQRRGERLACELERRRRERFGRVAGAERRGEREEPARRRARPRNAPRSRTDHRREGARARRLRPPRERGRAPRPRRGLQLAASPQERDRGRRDASGQLRYSRRVSRRAPPPAPLARRQPPPRARRSPPPLIRTSATSAAVTNAPRRRSPTSASARVPPQRPRTRRAREPRVTRPATGRMRV